MSWGDTKGDHRTPGLKAPAQKFPEGRGLASRQGERACSSWLFRMFYPVPFTTKSISPGSWFRNQLLVNLVQT